LVTSGNGFSPIFCVVALPTFCGWPRHGLKASVELIERELAGLFSSRYQNGRNLIWRKWKFMNHLKFEV